MTAADFAIIGVVLISCLLSIVRGFIKEAISLIAWIAAFVITGNYYKALAAHLTYFDDGLTRTVIAILVLFISSLIAVGVLGNLIKVLIKKAGLSGTDRLLGIAFGFARGILIVCAILALCQILFKLHILSFLLQEDFWRNSVFIPELMRIVSWFFVYLGTDVGV